MKRNGHFIPEANSDSAFSDGERTGLAHHDAGEQITTIAERCGISIEQAADIISEIEETMEAGGNRMGGSGGAVLRMIKRGMREIICSRTYRRQSFLMQCLMLTLGWHDELDGADNPTKLARKFGYTKANADKFYCFFRDRLTDGLNALPAARGQRDEHTRAKFASIRRKQEHERRQ